MLADPILILLLLPPEFSALLSLRQNRILANSATLRCGKTEFWRIRLLFRRQPNSGEFGYVFGRQGCASAAGGLGGFSWD
jgi:hypothetical protein